MRKFTAILITVIVLGLIGFIYWHYYFVFAEGTRAGVLNTFQKKGYLFKTYEGQLIQSGFRGNPTTAIQSNQFSFSVTNENVAQKLRQNGGKDRDRHNKGSMAGLPGVACNSL